MEGDWEVFIAGDEANEVDDHLNGRRRGRHQRREGDEEWTTVLSFELVNCLLVDQCLK